MRQRLERRAAAFVVAAQRRRFVEALVDRVFAHVAAIHAPLRKSRGTFTVSHRPPPSLVRDLLLHDPTTSALEALLAQAHQFVDIEVWREDPLAAVLERLATA